MTEENSNFDIFSMLSKDEEKTKKKRREELLASSGMKDLFAKGSIEIDKRTCWGLECKLCIKACPTNALYWKAGEIGIVRDLCVYCGACVLSCMVDDCIKIERERDTGRIERFSKPKEVLKLEERISSKKRFKRVEEVFPNAEVYCEKYERSK